MSVILKKDLHVGVRKMFSCNFFEKVRRKNVKKCFGHGARNPFIMFSKMISIYKKE